MSQIIHESGQFNFIKENLNYSANGLLQTFPKYFNADNVGQYARQPILIGNRVYANRMGNGDEESGDGFRFRGRGLIQVTGRANYEAMAKAFAVTLDTCVNFLETPEGAVSSAGWYWDVNRLNTYCDADNFTGLTRRINGGLNGINERRELYCKALVLFSENK